MPQYTYKIFIKSGHLPPQFLGYNLQCLGNSAKHWTVYACVGQYACISHAHAYTRTHTHTHTHRNSIKFRCLNILFDGICDSLIKTCLPNLCSVVSCKRQNIKVLYVYECLFVLLKMPGHCKFNYSCLYNNNYQDGLSKIPDNPHVDST